ncbi:hypothetical protein C5C00_11405 [Rathayibacter rathayi]|nr:hypothetical protein C5C47_10985 [Rathayibacter rathayi]PPG94892.1 hypothetical protein C5C00_11405 [Rathayibacter rathayi]
MLRTVDSLSKALAIRALFPSFFGPLYTPGPSTVISSENLFLLMAATKPSKQLGWKGTSQPPRLGPGVERFSLCLMEKVTASLTWARASSREQST